MTAALQSSPPPQILPPPRPFVKWLGGKRELAEYIVSLGPPVIRRYFERFLGGGALAFHLKATGYAGPMFLSDANRHLITTYRVVRDQPERLIAALGRHKTTKRHYYDVRRFLNTPQLLPVPVEIAAAFIFLNKTCHAGVYRESRNGTFNTPWGYPKKPYVPDAENIRSCSAALQGAVIEHRSFEIGWDDVREGDFVYFDPPYIPVSGTADFTAYVRGGFGPERQEQLRDLAQRLRDAGARVVLSNADVPEARALYAGFDLHEVQMRRAINSKSSARGPVSELLAVAPSVVVARD